jgi:outer membrane protein OmpA-like peptidoglycan-associated protein
LKQNLKYIIILFLLILPIGLLKSQNQLPAGAEEGLFSIKYSYFSIDVSTVMYKDSVYIPFSDLLNMLKIYYDVSNRNEIKGFVFNKDSSFSLNTQNLTIQEINNKTTDLKPDDFVKTNLETYVLPSIFEKIFHVSVFVKTKQLKIHIVSNYKFPILLENERENKYSSIKNYENSNNVELPLLYGRNWSFIDGGMMDYNISGSQGGGRQSYGLGGNIGFQLLGGEMQYNISTNYNLEYKILNKNENYRWRYSFTENNYISQIALGSIINSQSRGSSILNMVSNSRNLIGIQISNESIKMPTSFSTITIQDKIQPDWQVELYVSDKLYAQTRTDNIGYYKFDLPITYGNTNIELKIYGPHGEFVSKKDIISVPGEILIPGQIKYNIGVGQDIQSKKFIGNLLFSIGITEWFTNTVNFEKEYEAVDYNFVDNSSITLFNNLLLNTSISPNKYYKGGLRIIFDKLGTYDFIYSFNNPYDTTSNRNQTFDITGGFPRLFDLPVNITFRGNRTESSQLSSNAGNISLALNLERFYISTRYGVSYNYNKINSSNFLNQNINMQIDYSWYKKPDFISFLGNTRFSLNSGYIFNTHEITSIGFTISQEIAKLINLNISNQYDPSSNQYSLNLSAMINTSYFRMNSSLQFSHGYANSYSEDINGSIRFDSNRDKLFLSNTGGFNSSSSGGASIRFYIDRNENGIYDEGDQDIEDGIIYVPGATIERDQKGIKRVLNLLPGGRYNLYVKPGSFKNPNIIPKVSEFSFIADPNSMKNIDLPCYMTGMIEGGVIKLDSNNSKVGQGGIKIHIDSKNNPDFHITLPVFSDGSFYKNGLIPDKYIVYVDSIQLNLLDCKSDPAFIEFEIRVSVDGDYVGNLDFVLSDNVSEKAIKKEIALKTAQQEAERVEKKIKQDEKNKASSLHVPESKNESNKSDKSLVKGVAHSTDKKIDSIKEELNPTVITTSKANESIKKDIKSDTTLFPKITDPIAPGKLSPLLFAKSKITFLSPPMKKYLDRIAVYLIANPKSTLQIDAHTDNFGTMDENLQVSKTRANEVYGYLLGKGISKYRLYVAGHGSLQPIADNKTAAGRAKNMRVELTLISN